MKPALVIGASGLVGGAIWRALGDEAIGTYRSRPFPTLRQLDARDAQALHALIDALAPRVVFFPAAEPNVDWCEAHPDEARALNVVPALHALAAATAAGARFVFFSSDYVFDGLGGPYGEHDAPAPVNVYGSHKLEVEQAVLRAGGTVIRTTGVFGLETKPGKNFVLRLAAGLAAGEPVRVSRDQISTPTWSDELAVGAIAVAEQSGIWNVAGPDLLARSQFARLVAEVFGLDPGLVLPVSTDSLGQAARRPLRGGLRTERLAAVLNRPPLSVRESLERFRAQFDTG